MVKWNLILSKNNVVRKKDDGEIGAIEMWSNGCGDWHGHHIHDPPHWWIKREFPNESNKVQLMRLS